MITLVEALNYRCLQYIRQPLDRFHVLVGPNASGKTTFLDVVGFLADFVSEGLDYAIQQRSPNFQDLLFGRRGRRFELALEFKVPEQILARAPLASGYSVCRYEVVVSEDPETDEIVLSSEAVRFWQQKKTLQQSHDRTLFPDNAPAPDTLIGASGKGVRRAVSKSRNGSTNFYSETHKEAGKGWVVNLRLSPQKSALGNLPEDEEKFPVSTWLKQLLSEGIQTLVLDSRTLRSASPPNQPKHFKTDASNLPWVVDEFRTKHRSLYNDWLAHVREALPALVSIDTIEQPWDRHRYLVLEYEDGLKIPSWTASDGTLRLLALTLPAFLPHLEGVFLIEEPENGIHPKAVETLHQALSSVYNAQVLVATHSPVLLGMVDPAQILCFAKNEEGASDIVRGDQHPMLLDWKHEVSLQDYFVSGVLG